MTLTNLDTHNINYAYAKACNGTCADCGMTPEECVSKPCPHYESNDTPCQGGCGKVRSILHSDDPKDWICNECRTKKTTPIPTNKYGEPVQLNGQVCSRCRQRIGVGRKSTVDSHNRNVCDHCKGIHFIAGSGSHGCLYDSCHVYDSYQDAVDGLADTFELGRTRKARLFADGSLELNSRKDGAEYCEIVKCTCGDPSTHED